MRKSLLDTMAQRFADGVKTARSRGATAARFRFSQTEDAGCAFEAGRLKTAETKHTLGYEIEVLVGRRRGVARGNKPEDLAELVSRAITLAQVGSEAHFDAYPPPAPVRDVKLHSPRTLALSREAMVAACQTAVDKLKAYDRDMFVEAGANRSESESLLVTDSGVHDAGRATRWSLSAGVQKTEGTDMLFAGHARSWRDHGPFFDPDCLAEKTVQDLRDGERIVDPPVGSVTMLLPPEALSMFLWALALGISGRNVAKGESPLKGRLGEKICDGGLTITDNPHCDFAPGAARMDDCGVPTRVLPVIEKGVLKAFLYDLDSAGLAGAQPTGHEACRPCRLEVSPGDTDSAQLLKDVKDGVLIKFLLGFGQSNIMNGDFSCNVGLGYRIRNGEIAGRVKNTMVAGNLYELLKQNVTLSRDRDPLLNLPWARLEGLSVSAAPK